MWELLLKDKWPLLNKWCDFLNRKHKKAISRDTWNQILDFSRMYNSSLFEYDAEGRAPSMAVFNRRVCRGADGELENRDERRDKMKERKGTKTREGCNSR